MSNKYYVQAIYDEQIRDVTGSKERWKDVLRLAGRIYRFEFDNILLIYAQRPHATLVGDYDSWKKVSRYVKRGSKGIAIFPSKALKPYMRYVFDIEDTGGKNQKLTWDLDEDNLKKYLTFLSEEGKIDSVNDLSLEELKNSFKLFTRTNVWDIMKSDFEGRISELNKLTGVVIKDFSEKRKSLHSADTTVIEDILYRSIMYVVGTRCGFDLSSEEQDFSQIENIRNEEVVFHLGSLVCDVSCVVLREINRNIQTMERRYAHGRDEIDLSRGRRNLVSGYPDARGSGTEFKDTGQVRKDGNELSERESQGEIQVVVPIRKAGTEDAAGGRRSEPDDGHVDGEVFTEAQANESFIDNGDVEDKRAGEDAGRRDSSSSDSIDTSLDKEIEDELNEIESLGQTKEATYVQASFFDAIKPKNEGRYTYLNPKIEQNVPHEYVVSVLLRGSGFQNGKSRILKMFENEGSPTERAKLIKKEYGIGGAGWPIEGYGLHGYDSFEAKGLKFQWRDEEGEKIGYLSWTSVEREIGALILTGEYKAEEIARIIETHEEDESEQEGIDSYAIPDEPESYRSSLDDNFTELGETTSKIYPEEEDIIYEDKKRQKSNYHFNLWEIETAGSKTRYKWNVEAIKLLKQIENEKRLATPSEQKILSRYAGWGGLSESFDDKNEKWSNEYKELKELLTEDEYIAARATVNNAFYTSPEIASCINMALVKFGFRGGNILEPSMGIGNFFGTLGNDLSKSKLYGVELDSISGRIAKQLYQTANISITGFENTTFEDNFFDVVVGNVPFGDYKVFDKRYNKHNFRIHDYFIAKSLDKVRPGGMVAVITTKGTLDKANPAIRKYIASRAELVGAIRLPNTAFKSNAGTEVTADILFLQKRERTIDIEPDWIHLGLTDNGISVNSYFAEHPDMILGRMEYDSRIYGEDSRYTVCVNDDENFNIYEAINNATDRIDAQITDFERIVEDEEKTDDVIPASPEVRNYTYTFIDGKLYYRENSQMARKEVSENALNRIKYLDEIRKITRELIDIQMEGCSEEELREKKRLLNVKYDVFVGKYGYITKQQNKNAFRDDSDYPLLCSLEEIDEEGNVSKADMFYKQTIKAKSVIDRVETAVEALNISINEFGTVNIPYMLSIYESDFDSLVSELEGIIFLNPTLYNENNKNAGWESADEYLSGNVREKLRIAKAISEQSRDMKEKF